MTTKTDVGAYSHIIGKFQMAITLQRVVRSPSRLFLGGFGDGGSIGVISRWIKSKMADGGYFENLQMAIYQQKLYFARRLYNDC